jgi:hypothetical protein
MTSSLRPRLIPWCSIGADAVSGLSFDTSVDVTDASKTVPTLKVGDSVKSVDLGQSRKTFGDFGTAFNVARRRRVAGEALHGR